MRQFLLLLALVGVLLLQASLAFAHPPSDIQLQFDQKTSVLTVTILHGTRDPKVHYINDVKVWLGNDQIITQKFKSQTDNTKQVVQYTILDAKPGSALKVAATCSRGGTLEKTLVVK